MPDVNILIYAQTADEDKARYSQWLVSMMNELRPLALSEPVLQGYIRVVTNPRLVETPVSMSDAWNFVDALIARPNCRVLRPGPRHLGILRRLCALSGVRGNLVADAAHAALAIEHDCEWVTADTDFARFAPELRWRLL